jgi:hypothetical protein
MQLTVQQDGSANVKREPMPMKWLHPDAEGCVDSMVQKINMAVKRKEENKMELTIVNQTDSDDDVQSQIDCCDDDVMDEDAEEQEDIEKFGVHSLDHDESAMLGLLGLIGMPLFDK